jgi:hypothetical protein
MREAPRLEREHREALRNLNRETTGFAIAHLMEELRARYRDLPKVTEYIDTVERDVKENADDFLGPSAPLPGAQLPTPPGATNPTALILYKPIVRAFRRIGDKFNLTCLSMHEHTIALSDLLT